MSLQNTSTTSKNGNKHCKLCLGLDNDEMVLCDGPCKKWYHLNCVGISEEQARITNPWLCSDCRSLCRNTKEYDVKSMNTVCSRSRKSTQKMLKQKEEILRQKEEILQREKKLLEEKEQLLKEQCEMVEDETSNTTRKAHKENTAHGIQILDRRPMYEINPPQLSHSQLAARSSVTRDLPLFTGKPEEWAVFISAYEYSTTVMGFNNYENLIRLQKALKGKARDIIGCQLSLPNCVPKIIETLRNMFGRPELIMNAQIMKIRQCPAVHANKLETLVEFSATIQNLCATLEATHLFEYDNNPLLVQELIEKIPTYMKLNWSRHSENLTKPGISAFGEWINDIAMCAWRVMPNYVLTDKLSKNTNYLNVHVKNEHKEMFENFTEKKLSATKCLSCSGSCKSLQKCEAFIKLTPYNRWKMVKRFKICKRCLKHRWDFKKECPEPLDCGKENCKLVHHPLLHEDRMNIISEENPMIIKNQQSHLSNQKSVLFQYVPVVLHNGNTQVPTMAFIDNGSDGTFLEEEYAKQLNLEGPKSNLCIKWSDDTYRTEQNSMILSLKISGAYKGAKQYVMKSVQTVKSLNLPKQKLNYEELSEQYNYVQKLPIQSYEAKPGILIGLNNCKLGIAQKIREGKDNEPVAIKSRLGWILCANIDRLVTPNFKYCNFHQSCQDDQNEELNRMVKYYFNLENLEVQTPKNLIASIEERTAVTIMESTTKRMGDRYETGLLWKTKYKDLPDSKKTAVHRLELLECRLNKNRDLKDNMQKQINDYIKKGYIRKLTEIELKETHERIWYLPIFPVFNPNKPGKTRMVWDAASKTEGISLNSMLLKGPDQLVSLTGVLHRFRQRKIAFTGDIAEMFHQVLINKEDQHAQRFLWREVDTLKPPDTYVMQVMTFGATCSPSSAQYVKNINAISFKDKFPKAVDAIIDDHYVDDLLTSVDTEEEAIKLARQIKMIHAKANFNIRKWKSNSAKVVIALEDHESENENLLNMDMDTQTEKVLGMWWSMNNDMFTYSLKYNKGNQEVLTGKRKPTKREILRILMSVYDPLGLIAHYLTQLKVLLQEVWRSKIDWDDMINEEQMTKWLKWIKLLPNIEKLCIPRCFLKNIKNWQDVEAQIHIFVDASKDVCAAVAYIRIKLDELIECSLLGAKTRVAPLKLMSIPRLELIAAVIGARYSKSLLESLSVKIKRTFFWSDSKTVLSWLRLDAKRIKGQFVAFRIAEIQDTTDIRNWRFVSSEENVADDATKWSKLPSFYFKSRWYQGPSFLLKNENEWPKDIEISKSYEELVVAIHQISEPIINFNKFSDWSRLLKVVGYLYRFIACLISKKQRIPLPKGSLTNEELQKATTTLYKLAQAESFPKEIKKLTTVNSEEERCLVTVHSTSSIYNYSPILDTDGVLRMKGRINAASYVNRDFKQPIILDRSHHITKLLVKKYHQMYYHMHHETVINEIRQRYCISKLRALLKRIRFECPKCKIIDLKPCRPEMAPLPAARLAAYTRPFTYVGVDYFGPIKVTVGRRNEKRWGCLFTCLTIRAIHIEIANGLDTDSFILCYRNFINRRGQTREIYCDCGTNFVSAEKELRKELKMVKHDQISDKFTNTETKFIFNPPASPHMGGSWERMIRSVKNTLYAIIPSRTPTDQLLRSYLIEVENIVNSRPLTYLPLESEENEALTPNHFILGSSSGVKPVGIFTDDVKILKSNWLMSQLYAHRFWKRWVNEYLPTLTRRPKWCSPEKPLDKGDIVIIIDQKYPRNCWPKGRVIEVHKAPDGQVRSATVQTLDGLYKRPAVKLAKLDLISPESELNSKDAFNTLGGRNVKNEKLISK